MKLERIKQIAERAKKEIDKRFYIGIPDELSIDDFLKEKNKDKQEIDNLYNEIVNDLAKEGKLD